jgi:hypothetical protein
MVVMSNHDVGDNTLSNIVKVICANKPPALCMVTWQQPSYMKGSFIVACERPSGMEHASYGEDILFYR